MTNRAQTINVVSRCCLLMLVAVLIITSEAFASVCGECDGGVTSLWLQYQGDSDANIVVKEGGRKGKIIFEGEVLAGGVFSFNGLKKDGKIGKEIKIFVDGVLNTKIHTSCSKPIGPGLVSGDFEVIWGDSLWGGSLCPWEEPPAGDCDNGKPQGLTMRYTGENCYASSHSQDVGKVSCSGDPMFAPTVNIIACDKKNIEDLGNEKTKIWFVGEVELGGTFYIDATEEGQSRLKAETVVYIFDNSIDNNLLQSVRFHTSCSQPLNVGDQFGSLVLVGFVAEGEIPPEGGE